MVTYLPTYIDNLRIDYPFKLDSSNGRVSIYTGVVSVNTNARVEISYCLKFDSLIGSRNYFSDSNQFYILPDFNYFPRHISNIFSINTIKFKIKEVIDSSFRYRAIYVQDNTIDSFAMPYVVMGNFSRINKGEITYYSDTEIDKYTERRICQINDSIESILQVYSQLYGALPIDSLKVFFLKRSGGHGIPDGIILNQKLLSRNYDFREKDNLLISHELGHLWWGYSVKFSDNSLNEAFAEFSSMYIQSKTNPTALRNKLEYMHYQCEIGELYNYEKQKYITNPKNYNNIYKTLSYIKLPIFVYSLWQSEPSLFLNCKQIISKYKGGNVIADTLLYEQLNNSRGFSFYSNSLASNIDVNYRISVSNNNSIYIIREGQIKPNYDKLTLMVILNDNSSKLIELGFQDSDTALLDLKGLNAGQIEKLIIDPNFYKNQNNTLDDVWIRTNRFNIRDHKYNVSLNFPECEYMLNEFILSLLYGVNSQNKQLEEILKPYKDKLKNYSINGLIVDIDPTKNKFRLIFSYLENNRSKKGFIAGNWINKGNILELDKISKSSLMKHE